MLKADLRKPESDTYREQIGLALKEAAAGFSLKELSAMLQRDERQIARWMTGSERAQFDVLLACAVLRPRLVIALARLAGESVEIETVIRVRRTA